jgi:hypothetical protein
MLWARPGCRPFLSVQEGCDKFCSFCVVPYTRGAEASRPAAAVLAEARALVGRGAREITLLGQNVNAYHGAGPDGAEWGLARLIGALARIPDLARIRYTTSHPADMDAALIVAHREERKLMPFLQLPGQSVSDRIVAAMNRKHRATYYLDLIQRLRRGRPDLALSSDIIVGFPGESEADFAATLTLLEAVGFAAAFCFKYSPRPGTPAASAEDQLPEPVKAERLARVQALLARQSRAFNQSMIGRRLPILFEQPGRREGQLKGRSPYLQPVHAPGPASLIGRIAEVEIGELGVNSLGGRLVVSPWAVSPLAAPPAPSPVAGAGPSCPSPASPAPGPAVRRQSASLISYGEHDWHPHATESLGVPLMSESDRRLRRSCRGPGAPGAEPAHQRLQGRRRFQRDRCAIRLSQPERARNRAGSAPTAWPSAPSGATSPRAAPRRRNICVSCRSASSSSASAPPARARPISPSPWPSPI